MPRIALRLLTLTMAVAVTMLLCREPLPALWWIALWAAAGGSLAFVVGGIVRLAEPEPAPVPVRERLQRRAG